jgi:hypothetical protein
MTNSWELHGCLLLARSSVLTHVPKARGGKSLEGKEQLAQNRRHQKTTTRIILQWYFDARLIICVTSISHGYGPQQACLMPCGLVARTSSKPLEPLVQDAALSLATSRRAKIFSWREHDPLAYCPMTLGYWYAGSASGQYHPANPSGAKLPLTSHLSPSKYTEEVKRWQLTCDSKMLALLQLTRVFIWRQTCIGIPGKRVIETNHNADVGTFCCIEQCAALLCWLFRTGGFTILWKRENILLPQKKERISFVHSS